MTDLAPAEQDARTRLTHDQAQELVLRTLATQSESLLRTAHRHSLCVDDAHDAFQRSMEIFLRRAPTLDPESAHRWLHVVVKHEAMEVRRGRVAAVGYEEVDLERQASPHAPTPEEQVLGAERTRRATEALRRLKPQELRAMWLKATGHSYAEIGAVTGYSATKVNRSLVEGRKRFLDRFEGIESGDECERWSAVLGAIAGGTATAEQLTDARPHLRNCPACRAQVRALHRRPWSALLPVGLLGTLTRFAERFAPGGAGEAVSAGAGAGAMGAGGAKLAALLATGAAATAGGGFVMAQEMSGHERTARPAHTTTATPGRSAAAAAAVVPRTVSAATTSASTRATPPGKPRGTTPHRKRLIARRHPTHVEFAPHGGEPAPPRQTEPPPPLHTASAPRTPSASSPPPAAPAPADSTTGEFSPQP
jgi:RNA polymerase sigma factor (sigma-70 family)